MDADIKFFLLDIPSDLVSVTSKITHGGDFVGLMPVLDIKMCDMCDN